MEPGGTQLTAGGSRRLCTLERASTPGGSQRSPIVYKQELTPAEESGSARKRRLDRNRQAEVHAARKLERGPKRTKPTALNFEQLVVESVERFGRFQEALDRHILRKTGPRLCLIIAPPNRPLHRLGSGHAS